MQSEWLLMTWYYLFCSLVTTVDTNSFKFHINLFVCFYLFVSMSLVVFFHFVFVVYTTFYYSLSQKKNAKFIVNCRKCLMMVMICTKLNVSVCVCVLHCVHCLSVKWRQIVVCFVYDCSSFLVHCHCVFVLKMLKHSFTYLCVMNTRLYMDLTLDTMHLIFMFRILCAIAVCVCPKQRQWIAHETLSIAHFIWRRFVIREKKQKSLVFVVDLF